MRKLWIVVAALLCAAPLVWAGVFSITYRCDLNHYAHAWTSGETPAWLTAWVLAVTLAIAFFALLIAPKVWRMRRAGPSLTRGEWFTLVLSALVLVLVVRIAPRAMADPHSEWAAFLGKPGQSCKH